MIVMLLRYAVRCSLSAITWVFILSLQWEGKMIFDWAHDAMVEVVAIDEVDRQLKATWQRLKDETQATISGARRLAGEKEESTSG